MVLMEYYQKLILKYFISAVCESQNDFLEFNLVSMNLERIVIAILLLFRKKRCPPPTSPLSNAAPIGIGQEPYHIKVICVVAVTEFVVNVVSHY